MRLAMNDDNRQLSLLGGPQHLNENDLEDFSASEDRVFELMKDGAWHTPEEIEIAAGTPEQPARGGTRRMRELRKKGCRIETMRSRENSRHFLYRISNPFEAMSLRGSR